MADAGGPYEIREGVNINLDASGSYDPDRQPGPLSYNWDLDNDGQFNDATGVAPEIPWFELLALRIGDDGPHRISVQVSDGASAAVDSTDLFIRNVRPTIGPLTNDGPKDEGSPVTFTISATDPAGDLDPLTYLFDFGDGATGQSAAGAITHTYGDNGTYTVKVLVDDGDTPVSEIPSATTQVTVRNVAPSVTLPQPSRTIYPEPFTLRAVLGATFQDPGDAGQHTFLWEVTADNGQVVPPTTSADLTIIPTAAGTYGIRLTVNDGDGGVRSGATSVFVDYDIAPLRVEGTFVPRNGRLEATGAVLIGRSDGQFPLARIEGGFWYDSSGVHVDGSVFAAQSGVSGELFAGTFDIPRGSSFAAVSEVASASMQYTPAGASVNFSDVDFRSDGLLLHGAVTLPPSLASYVVPLQGGHALQFSTFGVKLLGGKIPLPETFALIIDQGFNLQSLGMEAEFLGAASGEPEQFRFRGSVRVPAVYNFSADFAGDENYVRLAGGQIDLIGKLSVEDITWAGGRWGLDELYVTFDTAAGRWGGGASLLIPAGFAIGAGVEFALGNDGGFHLDVVTLSKTGINRPLGTSGAFLQDIVGSVRNLARIDPHSESNLLLEANVRVTAGPATPIDIPLPTWLGGVIEDGTGLLELQLKAKIDRDHFEGTGEISILDRVVAASARAKLNWSNGFLDLSGQFGVPGWSFLNASAAFRVDSSHNITLFGSQTFAFPDLGGLIRGQASAHGAGYFQYRKNASPLDDYFLSYGSVSFGPFNGNLGLKVDFTGDLKPLIGMEQIAPYLPPGEGGGGGTPVEQRFEIRPGMTQAFFFSEWANDLPDAQFELVAPDGTTRYTRANIAGQPNVGIAEAFSDARAIGIGVNAPALGVWTLRILDSELTGPAQISAYHDSSGPEIDVLSARVNSDGLTATVDFVARDEDSSATISFFADSDGAGNDGVLLQDGIVEQDGAGSFTFNLASMPPSFSRVYAMISDGDHPFVFDYAPPMIFGKIEGAVFRDADGDGVRDLGDTAADGFTVFLDRDQDGSWDANEQRLTTGADGRYSFALYDRAPVQVVQAARNGWALTYPGRLGQEIQVNTATAGPQYRPDVAVASDGSYVVAWTTENTEGREVIAQRFRADGTKLGGEFLVNQTSTGEQYSQAVAIDSQGRFLVTWNSQELHEVAYRQLGRLYNKDGDALTNEFLLSRFPNTSLAVTDVAFDGAGNFVAVFTPVGDGNENYAIGRRFNSLGEPLGDEFRINTTATVLDKNPRIAMHADGHFVVAWTSFDADGSAWNVYAQRFDRLGAMVGGEFRVNTTLASYQASPSVAMDERGNIVIAWESGGHQDGSAEGVYARRYDATRETWSDEFLVNYYTSGYQAGPSIAMTLGGGFLIAWSSENQDGSLYGVFAQHFHSDGTPSGDEFRVNSYTTSDQGGPVVSAAPNGQAVVVWVSLGQDGDHFGIFGQRFGASGNDSAYSLVPFPGSVWSDLDFGAQPIAPGAVQGSVWNDADGDSRRDAGEAGAQGWRVYLDTNRNGVLDPDERSVYTGADGAYRFDNVAPGGYRVGQVAEVGWEAPLPSAIGPEFRVNATTQGDQFRPKIAYAPNGEFVVAWAGQLPFDGTAGGLRLEDGNLFGTSVARLGDLDGDGVSELVVGAPKDRHGPGEPGAVHVLFMNADGSVKRSQTIGQGIGGGAPILHGDDFGIAVAALGDLDGDGVPELVVGASGDDTGGPNQGAIHVLFLNSNGTVKSSQKITSGTAGGPTLEDGNLFGSSVASLGDLDGDGVPDLVVGAPQDRRGPGEPGAIHVLFMNANGTVRNSQAIGLGIGGGVPIAHGDRFGAAVTSLGDLNGDGVTDLAVGAPGDIANPEAPGAVHVLFLTVNGVVNSSERINGAALEDDGLFGASVSALGDLDGDGVTDLAVGAPADASGPGVPGALHVLFMNRDGTLKGERKVGYDLGGGVPIRDGDRFGGSVTLLGDLNGDGRPVLAVGASGDDSEGAERGAVHVLQLNSDGTVERSKRVANVHNLYVQRFNAAGNRLGAELLVSPSIGNEQIPGAIAFAADGSFVVVWQDGTLAASDVYARRFAADGAPLVGATRVNQATVGAQSEPGVAIDALGNFTVVWTGFKEVQGIGNMSILVRKFDAQSVALTDEFMVNTSLPTQKGTGMIAMTPVGDAIVVWDSIGQDGSVWGVYGQRLNSAGDKVGPEFLVNQTTPGNQLGARVAVSDAGNFVVTWFGVTAESEGRWRIFARAYDRDGHALTDELLVDNAPQYSHQSPIATFSPNGDFLIAWMQGGEILARRFLATGQPAGDQFRVNDYGAQRQDEPDLSRDAHGNLVIAWHSELQDGSERGVFARRFASSVNEQYHEISVDPFSTTNGVNFANRAGAPGSIEGFAWNDANGNGRRDDNESARDARVVYLDYNENGARDVDEPTAVTERTGFYKFSNVLPGSLRVAQVLASGETQSAPFDLGPEFQVVSSSSPTSDGTLSGGHSAVNARGQGAVAWIDRDFVLARRLDSRGTLVGETFIVATGTTQNESIRVAVDESGGFVIVWNGKAAGRSDSDIFGRRYAADGAPLGPYFQANAFSASSQISPEVAIRKDGVIGVVYNELFDGAEGYAIFAQLLSPDGTKLGGELVIDSLDRGSKQVAPDVAFNPVANGFVVTWTSYLNVCCAAQVYARLYDDQGRPLGVKFLVHPATMQSEAASDVAFDAAGNWDVTWNTYAGSEDLLGRRFDSAGIALGPVYAVNLRLPGDQHVGHNSLAVDPRGNLVAAWRDNTTGDIVVRLLHREDANADESEDFVVGAGTNPSVSVDAAGDIFVSWLREGEGVMARRISLTFNRPHYDLRLEPGGHVTGILFGSSGHFLLGDTDGDGHVGLSDLNNVRNHFGGVGLGDADGDGTVGLNDLNAVRNNFGASAFVLGDTNRDGQVNLLDLNNIRNNFGGTGLGDADGDGDVDLADLNAVRNSFGTGVPLPIVFSSQNSLDQGTPPPYWSAFDYDSTSAKRSAAAADVLFAAMDENVQYAPELNFRFGSRTRKNVK